MPRQSLSVRAFCRAFLGAAGALCAVAAPAGAQPAPPSGLTGIWLLDQRVYDNQEAMRPPLTPAAEAAAQARRKARESGGEVLSEGGKKCLPTGMPGMVTNEFALQFLETPGLVTVVSENNTLVRSIFLDGRPHPTDQEPAWNGHSTGKWDGKVLVVDTVNLNDRITHLPFGSGGGTSLSTHITERYHVDDGGKALVNEMTFEDPNLLTRPWTVTYRYHRADAGSELWEYVCETETEGWSERYKGDPDFKPKALNN